MNKRAFQKPTARGEPSAARPDLVRSAECVADGLLEGTRFPLYRVSEEEQRASVHALIWGFWRDIFWFRKALGRGHRWEAEGWLEKLRYAAVKLACMREGCEPGMEGYHEAERILPEATREEILATWCAPKEEALLAALGRVTGLVREVAPPVAERYGVAYPHDLEAVVLQLLTLVPR